MASFQQSNNLKIDSVLSTQAELGPSIPDGGYGWVILLTALFFQLLVPSLIVGYGILLVFMRIESNSSVYPTLWDNPMVYAPLFFIATWTAVDPWIRRLIETSKWPRLVTTSGVCLTCAGMLLVWFAIANGSRTAPWFASSGLLSGTGASLIISQSEVLLAQYFKLKLKSVNVTIQIVAAIGFIGVPIILGNNIIIHGLLTPIVWYQIIILQGMIVAVFIKKPPYLKTIGNPYKLIQATTDDEIDIFTNANTRELQEARMSQLQENIGMIDKNKDGPSLADELAAASQQESSGTIRNISTQDLIDIEVHAAANGNPAWIKFEQDGQQETMSKRQSIISLEDSYSKSLNQDLDRIDTFEDSFVHVPKPLYAEMRVNNNNSYSFDGGDSVSEDPVVFMPPTKTTKPGLFDKYLYFVKQPTFYKSLLQIITTKYSIFMFYALFPSYIYMRIENLKIHHTCFIVGYLSLAHLLFAALNTFVDNSSKKKALFLWISSWNGALGFILLTDVKSETWFIIGAVQIVISIQSLQYFGMPLLHLNRKGESNTIHLVLSSISGGSFLIFFAIDISYINCFRLIALLQFVMGGMWFANFTFKKIKYLFLHR